MKEKKVEPPFLRTEHNYDRNAASLETALKDFEPTRTQQQFAEESDINYIANRYGLTGEMPQVLDLPKYGDFTGIFDFQSAQNAVVEAQRQFMELPAKLRSRFDNDPQQLLRFLEDPANREEAEFLKLIEKRPENEPQSPTGDATPGGKGALAPEPPEPPKEPEPRKGKSGKSDT